MINYVLGHFADDERKKLPEIIGRAGDAVDIWLSRDIQKAMTLVNAETSPAHAVH
ncbi:MAG: hypothetical protein IJR11_02195 [Synergistaceae bacterium]|nr:hypothetical protein [Synergistaceae bacterium]